MRRFQVITHNYTGLHSPCSRWIKSLLRYLSLSCRSSDQVAIYTKYQTWLSVLLLKRGNTCSATRCLLPPLLLPSSIHLMNWRKFITYNKTTTNWLKMHHDYHIWVIETRRIIYPGRPAPDPQEWFSLWHKRRTGWRNIQHRFEVDVFTREKDCLRLQELVLSLRQISARRKWEVRSFTNIHARAYVTDFTHPVCPCVLSQLRTAVYGKLGSRWYTEEHRIRCSTKWSAF
mgnify:CR=1 FL=1